MGNNMNYAKYGRGQMMPRVTDGCETCREPRMTTRHGECETCDDARMTNRRGECDTCADARVSNRRRNCDDCNMKRDELKGMPLAMGYVPWHTFECTYEPMQGLRAGTIFPELDKPFYGRRGMR